MAVDPYAPCPCGSGKKLKFCCKDLAGDIEKVHRLIQGEQPHAALNHVQHLMEKAPQREALLDLRAMLELSLHELDAAGKTIETFLAAHPRNPSAYAHRAILISVKESGTAAIPVLQDSIELLENEMPMRVLEAIGAVGQALLLQGELIAARGHLLLYAGIAPEDDNRGLELLMRMNLEGGLPLLLRDYLSLADCPQDAPWREQYQETLKLSVRGLWRKAESLLEELRDQWGPVPEIVYSLALLRGWLGNVSALAAGMHEYSQLELPLDDAVEAEALAQLIDPSIKDPQMETVRLVYPIIDDDALADIFVKDQRVEHYALDPRSQSEDETTRPRSTHLLLDRIPPATGVDLQRNEVPHVVGFLSVYGKRTDREARLEVTADRSEWLDDVQKLIKQIVADSIGELAECEVLAEKSISEEALSWRWRLPDDTPADHRRKLLAEQRREAILERWTAAPQGALGEKSPQEAAGDPQWQIPLLASVLIVEQAAVDPAELSLFADLREKLDLPPPKPCSPKGAELEHLPLVRIPRLNLAELAIEPLARLLGRCRLMGANVATLLVAEELVQQQPQENDGELVHAYRELIRLEPDHQRVSSWLEKARAWSRDRGESAAEWALMELDFAIEHGDAPRVQNTLNEIRDFHIKEPGVAEATYRMLYDAGLIAPPEESGAPTPMAPQPAATHAPASEGQGIWTPGGDSAAEQPSESREKPAIWTP